METKNYEKKTTQKNIANDKKQTQSNSKEMQNDNKTKNKKGNQSKTEKKLLKTDTKTLKTDAKLQQKETLDKRRGGANLKHSIQIFFKNKTKYKLNFTKLVELNPKYFNYKFQVFSNLLFFLQSVCCSQNSIEKKSRQLQQ